MPCGSLSKHFFAEIEAALRNDVGDKSAVAIGCVNMEGNICAEDEFLSDLTGVLTAGWQSCEEGRKKGVSENVDEDGAEVEEGNEPKVLIALGTIYGHNTDACGDFLACVIRVIAGKCVAVWHFENVCVIDYLESGRVCLLRVSGVRIGRSASVPCLVLNEIGNSMRRGLSHGGSI